MRTIRAADLFCGAGGTSTGLALACEELGLKVDLLALNHWAVAIQTHEANHPWARHLCKSLHEVDPRKAVPGGRLDLLVASPECTHHSIARGGKPVSDQMRMSAWQIVDWLAALRVDSVIVENVREFRDWGPIDSRGRPLKSRKGEIYQAFLRAIESLGYRVEEQLLNAADFGDPTTRIRLFIIARRGRKPIVWPQPSHYPTDLLGQRWVPARKIIDWAIRGQSIFTRKRPLSPNTLARIYAGLRKFGGVSFIVGAGGPQRAGKPQSIEEPLGTLLTRNHRAVVQPFVVALRGTSPDQVNKHSAQSVEEPLQTITAGGIHAGLVEPFILPHRMFDGMQVDSVEQPLRTIVGKNGGDIGLVQPFIVPFFGERDGQKPRTHSVEEPLPAVTSHGAGGLVEPFLTRYHGGKDGARRNHSVDEPIPVIDTSNRYGLVEPFLVNVKHGKEDTGRPRSVETPIPTVTAKNGLGLVEAYLVKYNGTGGAQSVEEPLDTITTRDRFALVEIEGEHYLLDIRFRMLQPRELAAAMGFPQTYRFSGTRAEQVRQIGNAVAVRTAKALCRSVLES